MTETIIWFVVLILLSGFFSGVEIAIFSLSQARVRTMVRQGLRGAKTVERLKSNPERLLVTILLGNNLVNIFAAAIATQLSLELFGSVGVGVATGVVTFLVLVFGEIFPKSLAQVHAVGMARKTARLVLILEYILFPFIWFLEKLAKSVTMITAGRAHPLLVAEEEIRSMLYIGMEKGVIERHEKDFVERLFKFNDLPVRAVLTPIEKVVMLDGDTSIEDIAHFVANSGYSRFPVFQESRQNIVGAIHIKNIMKANNSDQRGEKLSTIVNKPAFVKESSLLDDVFRQMQKMHLHHMLVQDSRGMVIGLITLEDIMEELVGEIHDESDKKKSSVVT